jgi:phosphonate transport system permease protein
MSQNRSPLVAGALSLLIPGAGQIYAGQRYRGTAILLGAIVAAGMVFWYGDPLWYFIPVVIHLWSAWDAFSLAGQQKARTILIPVSVAMLAAYAIGWQVVGIDFSAADANRALQILRPMVNPDFVQPRRQVNSMWTNIEVPCSPQPAPAHREENGKTATVIPDCSGVGETLIVNFTGLWPNAETEVVWNNPIGNAMMLGGNEDAMLIVKTDETGSLTTTIRVPSTALVAAPDPTLPQNHRVYAYQYKQIGGIELSYIGGEVAKGALTTIGMALIATLLAVIFAIPISFLAAQNLMGGNPLTYAIYVVMRTILNILRSIESLIMAIVFVVIVGLGPFAGVLALAMHSIAALAKLYSEVIEGIDPGPIEAIRATGADWLQTVRYAVIPQIIPPFTAFTIYRWDINVRSATIVGFVGGGGLGFLLIELIRVNNMRGVSAVFITIAIIVTAMDYISAKIRERLA